MDFIKKWIENASSKKFLLALAALFTYLSDKDPGQSWPIAIIAAVYIAAQAYVDATKAKNGVK
jgi:hypothetical protein